MSERADAPLSEADRESDLYIAIYSELPGYTDVRHDIAERIYRALRSDIGANDEQITSTRVEVLGHPDKPVSARCCLDGCQDFSKQPCVARRMEPAGRRIAFHEWLDYSWPMWKQHEGNTHYVQQRSAFNAGIDAAGDFERQGE